MTHYYRPEYLILRRNPGPVVDASSNIARFRKEAALQMFRTLSAQYELRTALSAELHIPLDPFALHGVNQGAHGDRRIRGIAHL